MDAKELRRLLELAAKAAQAAGANIIDSEAGPQIFERYASDGSECYRIWLPNYDDGEALRLAVLLRMKVYPGEAYCWDAAVADYSHSFSGVCDEDEEPDTFAATRLAVLRAAAAIGEAMP